MRTISVNLYKYNELTDEAKAKAREWFRQDMDYFWLDDGLESIKTFCARFGVKVPEYSIGAFSPIEYRADYSNENFRGMKLKDFNREYMPTGYFVDCALWQTFFDVFKDSGDAKAAFDKALYAGFMAIRDDMEAQYSDESVEDSISINDYEFTESGAIA
jgi:hypothetical protein